VAAAEVVASAASAAEAAERRLQAQDIRRAIPTWPEAEG